MQEALLSAWRGLSALRDPDAWDAWLHRLLLGGNGEVPDTTGNEICADPPDASG